MGWGRYNFNYETLHTYYIGNTKSVENSIEIICQKISDRKSDQESHSPR